MRTIMATSLLLTLPLFGGGAAQTGTEAYACEADGIWQGVDADQHLGHFVISGGDVDGDGKDDLLGGPALDFILDASGHTEVVLPGETPVGETGRVSIFENTGQPDPTPGAVSDAFVMQLDAGGTQILYNTYLGGFANGTTQARAVKRMPCGEALVVGQTFSPFFPIVGDNPFDPTFNGADEGFIARVQVMSPWTNLGGSLQGSAGRPKLKGGGGLCEHSTTQLQLTVALPGALAALVMGFTNVSLPFKGGTLVPSPDLIFFGLPVDANGQLLLVSDWPPGIPPGVQLAMQYWIADPGTPAGYSASNGLLAVTP